MAGFVQRRSERADDQAAHQPGIAEAHFGLRRMHIHVDKRRIAIEKQRQRRMAVAREIIGIGAAHRADQQPVAHRPAVDDEKLHRRIRPVVSGQPRESRDAHAFACGFDRRGVVLEVTAHDPRKALQAS